MMTGISRTAWIDLTMRPEGEAEVDVNPMTGEFEFTWQLEGDGGRITLLIPRESVATVVSRTSELLALR